MSVLFGFLRSTLSVRLDLHFLADQVMLLHGCITLLTGLWALLIGLPWLSVLAALLWLLTFVIWLEFKHLEG